MKAAMSWGQFMQSPEAIFRIWVFILRVKESHKRVLTMRVT